MITITTTPSTLVSQHSWVRSIWELRYRIVAICLLISILPLFYANNSGQPRTVEAVGFTTKGSNIFVSNIEKNTKSLSQLSLDLIKQGANKDYFDTLDFRFSDLDPKLTTALAKELQEQKKRSIKAIIKAPDSPQLVSYLKYPKHNINVPIKYTALTDLYQSDEAGNLLKNNAGDYIPIEENVARDGPLGVPIQRLLVEGIVHVAITPLPGEVGNSYIVGHSSNFSSVQSDYNYIFKPLERNSQVGEEFYIYDKDGRELKFRVFETDEILEREYAKAIQPYGDKRVVTLQCSILEWVPGQGLQPTKRWLTRGELVL
jgi:hypothetical protein